MSEPFYSRWNFLTMPLAELLANSGAVIVEVIHDNPDFMGHAVHSRPYRLEMPVGQNDLEREGVARYFLAERVGLDITDWPIDMHVVQYRPQAKESL